MKQKNLVLPSNEALGSLLHRAMQLEMQHVLFISFRIAILKIGYEQDFSHEKMQL